MEAPFAQAILFSPLPLPRSKFLMEIGIPKTRSTSFSLVRIFPYGDTFGRTKGFDPEFLVTNCELKLPRFRECCTGGFSEEHQVQRVLFGNVSNERPKHSNGYPDWKNMGDCGEETNAYSGIQATGSDGKAIHNFETVL